MFSWSVFWFWGKSIHCLWSISKFLSRNFNIVKLSHIFNLALVSSKWMIKLMKTIELRCLYHMIIGKQRNEDKIGWNYKIARRKNECFDLNVHQSKILWLPSHCLSVKQPELPRFPDKERICSPPFMPTREVQPLFFCILTKFVWPSLGLKEQLYCKELLKNQFSVCQNVFPIVCLWSLCLFVWTE